MALKLYDEEKVQAIANGIREKTGLTDLINMQQMILDIESLPKPIGTVPDYVYSEAERVAEAVKPLLSGDSLCFIALSDVHVGSDVQSRTSALHAFQGARILQKLLPVDFSVVLGDWVTGGPADDADIHTANHVAALGLGSILHPELRMVGNHDQGSYNQSAYLSAEETNKYIGRYSYPVTKPSYGAERGYFHCDLSQKKTRIICLNSGDLGGLDFPSANATDGHYMSAAQFQWLVDTLSSAGTAGMTRILLLSHHPLHWYGYMPSVLAVLNAYIAGSSGSVTVNGTSVSYNFSGKNSAQLIGCFHGHTHNFISGKVGENEIIRIGTPNACFSRSNEYGSASYGDDFRAKYGETTTYAKTANSAKDTAFVVNVIDFGEKTIHSIHYGAGYDRIISYGADVYYSISYTLTNVTSSSAIATIKSGEAYTTTLSVADNYTIKSVTVTMGGVNITSSAYSNGTISISEVTGDVVITAMATGFTNQIPISIDSSGAVFNGVGYKTGYRLSTSSGKESAASGMTVTGFIPVPNSATIRIKGIDLTSGNSTMAWYGTDFTFISGAYCNGNFEAADANGVRKKAFTNSAGYIRISGAFGENPIITVNEEIS